MTIALTANQAPNGTLPGSPTKIIDVHTDSSNTRATLSVPIPASAKPGDLVCVFFGVGWTGPTGLITGFSQVGPQFQTTNWGPPGLTTATGAAGLSFLWRVVQPGDPGTSSEWRWTQGNWMTWSIYVYTLRFVDTVSPIQVQGAGAQQDNVVTSGTGSLTPTVNNVLMIAAIMASAGVGTAIVPGPLPAWQTQPSTGVPPNDFQPSAGMVSGVLDQPLSGLWQGAGCQWQGGSPTVQVNVSYAGLAFGITPPPWPGAPTLTLTPSGTSIDAAGQGGTLLKATIAYTPVRGQGQLDAWYLGRQPHAGGAVQWWNAAANQWQTGEFANLDAPVVDPVSGLNTFTYTLPASAFADDSTNWNVAAFVRESGLGYKSASSTVQTFTADPPPVVTAVSITNPNSATPTIGWTESITKPASVQTQYRARLFALATTLAPGFDPGSSPTVYASGLTTSAALSQVTTALAGGQDLVPYVQITQTGGQVSAWKAGPVFFNNQGAALAVPTVVAAPSTDLVTGAPRVALTLSGTATTALVEYSDDQVTWYTVRDQHTGQLAAAVALSGSPTIYDGEAPPGADRFYRATGYSAAGAYPRSASSTPVSAIAPLGQFWLRRPLAGDSLLLKVTGDKIVEKLHEDATRYSIGGRRNAVWVRESPVHGVTLKFSLYFTDQGSSDKFDAMRDAQETLLLQSDTSGKQWYIALPPEPERPLRLTGSRLAGKPIRDLDLEVDEQDRP